LPTDGKVRLAFQAKLALAGGWQLALFVKADSTTHIPDCARLKLVARGAVQGVGFRPFVHRLATTLKLTGWVNNSPQGVFIEA
jgi:hypothetical protein